MVSETNNEGPIPSPEAYTTRGNWVFLDFPRKFCYTYTMHIFRVSLLDYATAFDLDIFASTEKEAREMAMREEPKMNITKVVCLTTIESI